ncbi:hypothetical protein BpHYR1_004559 [Brachionus plicatilis]|uniref:Uncharacterized protein n=1 Tax=Brachionus plicatilis TaxID=10195 RepID=A0A3M7PA00_BRAPC|nr:hypothetical protein BpHYR1_004559 [Brachionus plicatilis]
MEFLLPYKYSLYSGWFWDLERFFDLVTGSVLDKWLCWPALLAFLCLSRLLVRTLGRLGSASARLA